MTVGRSLFSLLSACFRDGATISHPYHSCTPAPLRTGQADFPYIRLPGWSFSKPPLYDKGSGLCGFSRGAILYGLRYSGTAIAGDSPRALDRRSPGYLPVVAQLDAVLDPGVSVSHSSVTCSPHGLRPSQKDRHGPKKITFLGAMCQIQGYTLHLAALVILLSDLVSSSFDY